VQLTNLSTQVMTPCGHGYVLSKFITRNLIHLVNFVIYSSKSVRDVREMDTLGGRQWYGNELGGTRCNVQTGTSKETTGVLPCICSAQGNVADERSCCVNNRHTKRLNSLDHVGNYMYHLLYVSPTFLALHNTVLTDWPSWRKCGVFTVRLESQFLYTIWINLRSWLRLLVASPSLRRPGFDPGPSHVECLMDKVPLGHVFKCFGLTLSVSFHQCSILFFILILGYYYQKDNRAKLGNLQIKHISCV
jgi:hypothetical protein